MRLTETLRLPLSPDEAARMYADPGYAEIRGRVLGAREASAAVSDGPGGAFVTTTTLVMPTDQVPDVVRPFVGASVTVIETQEWEPASGSERHGRIRFEVLGAPASMSGTLLLRAAEGGCTVAIEGDVRADVPLLGRRIEKAALPYVSTVLRHEERAAAQWAAEHDG